MTATSLVLTTTMQCNDAGGDDDGNDDDLDDDDVGDADHGKNDKYDGKNLVDLPLSLVRLSIQLLEVPNQLLHSSWSSFLSMMMNFKWSNISFKNTFYLPS